MVDKRKGEVDLEDNKPETLRPSLQIQQNVKKEDRQCSN